MAHRAAPVLKALDDGRGARACRWSPSPVQPQIRRTSPISAGGGQAHADTIVLSQTQRERLQMHGPDALLGHPTAAQPEASRGFGERGNGAWKVRALSILPRFRAVTTEQQPPARCLLF